MSFVYDNEVKEKLGEEKYRALINAVEVKAILAQHVVRFYVSHQVGVINKGIMAELANALGPRIRGGHLMRMDHGAKADRVEMRKVRGIDMVRFPNPLPVASGSRNMTSKHTTGTFEYEQPRRWKDPERKCQLLIIEAPTHLPS